PNPPAVGDPETIGDRTAYYLVLLVGSALAMFAAARVMWSMKRQAAPWARPLAGAGTFIAVAGGLALALPGIQEIPEGFPAPLIWEFRLSSLGTQAVLWASLGIGFGIASHRATAARAPAVA
ncbi:MAG TPA: CbtA family protein, partial [Solirubrobacteraceae bacterium]|nr:CbtA family protein [Solirubrobacteraceae bacterium]